MRIQNCNQNVDIAISAPLQQSIAEPDWIEANERGYIPRALFALYVRANYLSLGGAPPFLSDTDHILFSYFGSVLHSIKESLVEAHEELAGFLSLEDKGFNPLRRGEPFDVTADDKAQRHLRNFVMAIFSALDSLSELIALVFTSMIPGLQVGRAQFTRVETWLSKPLPTLTLIVSAQQHHLEALYKMLEPLVNSSGPEKDWLALARMVRNKSAHIGSTIFRILGLQGPGPKMYRFMCRQWPFIWQKDIKPAGAVSNVKPINEMLDPFMHQDIRSFTSGLMGKIMDVMTASLDVIEPAYRQLSDNPQNDAALKELQGNAESFAFESFANN